MRNFYDHIKYWLGALRPVHTIFILYVVHVLIIFLLLSLPICWRADGGVSWIDTLAIATSVISTSALTPVNTADVYNFLGEIVILIGVQMGGLGYMIIGSYAILASKGRVSDNRINIGRAVFSMPSKFKSTVFLKHIIAFTLSIEAIGTILLWQAFTEENVPNPFWAALFHSIMSFCTAGFSTFSNNLVPFAGNVKINIIVASLSLLGAIGFIVLDDFARALYRAINYEPNNDNNNNTKFKATLTTRIILVSTFSAVFLGTILLFFDASIVELPIKDRVLVSFFQTVSALTTSGFCTYPIAKFSAATAMIIIILMILGASPCGTGGGLKSTTWSAAIGTIMSSVYGRKDITFFGCVIPHGRINAAFAAFALYLITFSIGAYLLLMFESHDFEDIVLEVASALSTVGLSRGITPELTVAGKIIIMVIMFMGRFGVISFTLVAVAIYHEDTTPPQEIPPSSPNYYESTHNEYKNAKNQTTTESDEELNELVL
jgi:trk system potassium uptake protein TrkH